MQTAPAEIEVGQTHIDNVELRVVAASDITGQLIFEDEQARQPASPRGQQTRQRAPQAPRLELREVGGRMSSRADVAADETFGLKGVQPGLYKVVPSWPAVYVKSLRLGTTAMEGDILDLTNGSGGEPLSVLLSSATGEISGLVSGRSGPLAGARITLVAEDFEVGARAATFTSGPDGSYRIASLVPGKYKLAVVEENDNFATYGDLDEYEDALARIEVRPQDKLIQHLRQHEPAR